MKRMLCTAHRGYNPKERVLCVYYVDTQGSFIPSRGVYVAQIKNDGDYPNVKIGDYYVSNTGLAYGELGEMSKDNWIMD